jgi:hypothetical protein
MEKKAEKIYADRWLKDLPIQGKIPRSNPKK